MHLKAAHVLLHGLAAREHGPLRASHAPVASKRDKCIAKLAQLAPKRLTSTQKLLRSVECELEHVRTFTKRQDTPRQLVPWGRWEGPARMLFEIQGQFHVRDLALAREPQQSPCPSQQGMQKRRLPRPMRRQPRRCIQRRPGRGHGQWARPKLVARIGRACVRRPAPRRAEDGRTVVPPLLGSVQCRLARREHGKEHPVQAVQEVLCQLQCIVVGHEGQWEQPCGAQTGRPRRWYSQRGERARRRLH